MSLYKIDTSPRTKEIIVPLVKEEEPIPIFNNSDSEKEYCDETTALCDETTG